MSFDRVAVPGVVFFFFFFNISVSEQGGTDPTGFKRDERMQVKVKWEKKLRQITKTVQNK